MSVSSPLTYESPEMTIIPIDFPKTLCLSGGTEDYTNNNDPDWFTTLG